MLVPNADRNRFDGQTAGQSPELEVIEYIIGGRGLTLLLSDFSGGKVDTSRMTLEFED